MSELLILVDQNDRELGKLDKMTVHKMGLLHRAFSVFIFNSKGELLLQQRADGKYHSAGLWTNTCCSHPSFGETTPAAVKRRLQEEMGMQCETGFVFSFIYEQKLDHGLTEHEYDHVYFGGSDALPAPDAVEVKNWKYIAMKDLENELLLHPDTFTAWLKICFSGGKKASRQLLPHQPLLSNLDECISLTQNNSYRLIRRKRGLFFSSPENLALICPPEMEFKILTKLSGEEIYSGMTIDYRVRPLLSIPMHWRTEIINVDRHRSFTDRQIKGPYAVWEHTHIFTPITGGTLMEDQVRYQLPYGALGTAAHSMIVRKKIENIFSYRKKVLQDLFKEK